MTILLFVAKIFICSGVFFVYYRLFLRNKKFHRYNRFYLLAVVIFSLTLPFINVSLSPQPTPVGQAALKTIDVISLGSWGENIINSSRSSSFAAWFTFKNLLAVLYFIVSALLLYWLIRSLLYIRRVMKQYGCQQVKDLKIYSTNEPGTPFSFFRSIFWNRQISFDSKDGQQIFRHELFHVRQQHSADNLFMEFIVILFWFNPFFHLIKRELKTIHEFLADQYAVSDADEFAYAELLLLKSIEQQKLSTVHPFFYNQIKRRIAMITQLKNKKVGYWSRLMALPLALILFCFIALKAQQSYHQKMKFNGIGLQPLEKPVTVIIDAGHGGHDPGARSRDESITEKDLTLALAKKIRALSGRFNINVVLTRDNDAYLELQKRIDIANDAKPQLLISLHTSAAVGDVSDAAETASREKQTLYVYASSQDMQKAQQAAKLGGSLMQILDGLYQNKRFIMSQNSEKLFMLENAPCPAILLDWGFITDAADLAFMNNEKNQEMVAEKILEGIVQYEQAGESEVAVTINNVAFTVNNPGAPGDTISVDQLNKLIASGTAAFSASPKGNYMEFKFENGKTYYVKKNEFELYSERKEQPLKHKEPADYDGHEKEIREERVKQLMDEEQELKEMQLQRTDLFEKEIASKREESERRLAFEYQRNKQMQDHRIRELTGELSREKEKLEKELASGKGKDKDAIRQRIKELTDETENMKERLAKEFEFQNDILRQDQKRELEELQFETLREREALMNDMQLREKEIMREKERLLEKSPLKEKIKAGDKEKNPPKKKVD